MIALLVSGAAGLFWCEVPGSGALVISEGRSFTFMVTFLGAKEPSAMEEGGTAAFTSDDDGDEDEVASSEASDFITICLMTLSMVEEAELEGGCVGGTEPGGGGILEEELAAAAAAASFALATVWSIRVRTGSFDGGGGDGGGC